MHEIVFTGTKTNPSWHLPLRYFDVSLLILSPTLLFRRLEIHRTKPAEYFRKMFCLYSITVIRKSVERKKDAGLCLLVVAQHAGILVSKQFPNKQLFLSRIRRAGKAYLVHKSKLRGRRLGLRVYMLI